MTNGDKVRQMMIRVLCDALDGCPLTYPCDKLWSPEGWCKDHCKPGQAKPDAECWLKYAEVMTSEALRTKDVPGTNDGDMISRAVAIDAASRGCFELRGVFKNIKKEIEALPSAQPEIVRCNDCKHTDEDGVCQNSKGLAIQDDYSFCSWAERRTDD